METGMEQPLPQAVDTSNEHKWLEANEAKKKNYVLTTNLYLCEILVVLAIELPSGRSLI